MVYSRRGLGADRDRGGVSSNVLMVVGSRSSENGANDEGSGDEQSGCFDHDG